MRRWSRSERVEGELWSLKGARLVLVCFALWNGGRLGRCGDGAEVRGLSVSCGGSTARRDCVVLAQRRTNKPPLFFFGAFFNSHFPGFVN